ncbi:MAG: patatin-like phospholipase family protein [Bryobacterales bacterium]|nr:patatin-like phospholipase family protein [Bryobacterales bacterium]
MPAPVLALVLSLAFQMNCLPAQTGRPKIGLVLEGGGAYGLAHIGVLEWLEQHHVPVDRIAGTSMGGMVGGLYASGMTTAELREMVSHIDWNRVLTGEVPFRALSFRRKQDRLAYPNRLELGLRGGIHFPGGLNSGQEIDTLLSRYTLGYADLASFDDLPVPFRCVATELISGTQKVFDRGSLADALRATMSLPAVFVPQTRDGKVYVDGGVVNNLPVDVAKQMGADITIAVHLSSGPVDARELRSLLGVLGRTVSVVVSQTEMRTMQLADIVVVADLKGFSNTDYDKWEAIERKGLEAAANKAGILSRFAIPAEEYQRLTAGRQARRKRPPERVEAVEVTGTSTPLRRAIEAAMVPATQGPLDTRVIEGGLSNILGLGRFESLSYRVVPRGGKPALEVTAREKAYGPPFFQPAVGIDGSDQSNVGFLFTGRITALDLGGFRSEWRTDFSFGFRYGLATEYFHPLTETSRFFVAPGAFAQNERFEVYDKGGRIADYRVGSSGAGLDFGISLSRFAELRAGYQFSRLDPVLRIGAPLFPEGGQRNDSASLRFVYEGQDDAIIPRRGLRAAAALRHYPRGNLNQMELRLSAATAVSETGSVLYGLAGGTSFGSRNIGLRSFSLGGPAHLGAYGTNELLGHQYLLATAGYERSLWSLPPLAGGRLYAIGLAQAARMDGALLVPGIPLSVTGMLAAKTAIGPVFVGASFGDKGHRKWFFGLGRIF